MYVQPTTDIYLLHGVPLDNTYDHTLYFSTITDQYNYFYSCRKLSFNNQTFQRVSRGFARVQADIGSLYDCNYMMFRNELFGGKWFYAFITSTEYINNQCSQINFEIDVLQTWHFNYKLDHCFIERQHTQTDAIGEHIEPESVALGEYVFNGLTALTEYSTDLLIVLGICDLRPTEEEEEDEIVQVDWSEGKIYDGVYGAMDLYAYHLSEINQINALIATYSQNPDAICAIYMIPNLFNYTTLTNHKLPQNAIGYDDVINNIPALTGTESLNGYTPDNKKLYTYPYNYYHVDNASGGGLDVRYEFFTDAQNNRTLKPTFVLHGTITQPVKLLLRPTNYKGATTWEDVSESLEINGFPQCSWNLDSYYAWVAQSAIPTMMKMGGAVINSIINYASGKGERGMFGTTVGADIIGSSTNLVGESVNALSQQYSASIQADICKGSINCGNVNVASQHQDFFGGRVSITANQARIIDDFFTRFGYAINAVAIPIRNARPHWTYIKTAGCTISPYTASQSQSGGVPNDDMRKICSIYNEGITWWKNPSEVGNYSLNNKPV